MNLNINFPDDSIAAGIIDFMDVPCVCKVLINGAFYVIFSKPLFDAVGLVNDFNSRDINSRFPVFGGSAVAQHCNAMISLKKNGDNNYQVFGLKFFNVTEGWVNLIDCGKFTPLDENKYEGY